MNIASIHELLATAPGLYLITNYGQLSLLEIVKTPLGRSVNLYPLGMIVALEDLHRLTDWMGVASPDAARLIDELDRQADTLARIVVRQAELHQAPAPAPSLVPSLAVEVTPGAEAPTHQQIGDTCTCTCGFKTKTLRGLKTHMRLAGTRGIEALTAVAAQMEPNPQPEAPQQPEPEDVDQDRYEALRPRAHPDPRTRALAQHGKRVA